MEIIRQADEIFLREQGSDRAEAFQNWCTRMIEGMHILVGARVIGLDRASKMIQEIHTMIGAPKKRTEEGQRAPMDLMAEWLNEA